MTVYVNSVKKKNFFVNNYNVNREYLWRDGLQTFALNCFEKRKKYYEKLDLNNFTEFGKFQEFGKQLSHFCQIKLQIFP